jgi:hypothetical protein
MSAREAIDALLGRAALRITDSEEYERLVRNYPYEQELLAQLRLDEVRYAEPAMVYRAG